MSRRKQSRPIRVQDEDVKNSSCSKEINTSTATTQQDDKKTNIIVGSGDVDIGGTTATKNTYDDENKEGLNRLENSEMKTSKRDQNFMYTYTLPYVHRIFCN